MTRYTVVICLLLVGKIMYAGPQFLSHYEEASQLVENIQHGYVYRSVQNYIHTLFSEDQLEEVTLLSSSVKIFYPSYLIASDDPSLLIVIPQSPNPFLLALTRELTPYIATENSTFSLLLLNPTTSTQLQEQLIVEARQSDIPVLWLDETVTAGELYTQKAPLHLITALQKVRKKGVSLQIHGTRLFENISQSFFTPSEVSPLAQADVPLITLKGRLSVPMTAEWGNAFISTLIAYADFLENEAPPSPVHWQHQYLSLLWGITLIVPEHILLLIAFLTVVFSCALGIFSPFSLHRFTSRIAGHWKAVVILLFLIVGSVTGAHLLIQLLTLSSFHSNWLLFIKIFLSVLIFIQAYHQISKLRLFHRATRFLSSLMILVTLALLVAAVTVHLSASLHAATLFLLMMAFSFSPHLIGKIIFFVLSLLIFLPEFFSLDTALIENLVVFLLRSPVWGNVFLTVALMPFLFTFLRLRHLISPLRRRMFLRVTQWVVATLIGIALLNLITSLSNIPSITGKQYISETAHRMEFTSKSPLGSFLFLLDNLPYRVTTNEVQSSTLLPLHPISFSSSISSQPSGELQNYSIRIHFTEPVDLFTLTFEAPGNVLTPYYADLPSSLPLGNPVEKISFTALFPPPSFQANITLTASQIPLISAEATYDTLSTSFFSEDIRPSLKRVEVQKLIVP